MLASANLSRLGQVRLPEPLLPCAPLSPSVPQSPRPHSGRPPPPDPAHPEAATAARIVLGYLAATNRPPRAQRRARLSPQQPQQNSESKLGFGAPETTSLTLKKLRRKCTTLSMVLPGHDGHPLLLTALPSRAPDATLRPAPWSALDRRGAPPPQPGHAGHVRVRRDLSKHWFRPPTRNLRVV